MARAISMALALSVSAVFMLVPFVVAREATAAIHGLASLMMIGVAGAFVHGVGFVPRHAVWRRLFSPVVAWPLVVGPAVGIFFLR
jgi:cyd operon protein YbgE